MHRRRTFTALLTLPLMAGLAGITATGAAAQPDPSGKQVDYTVVTTDGASLAEAKRAIRGAGGKVVRDNATVGVITASAPESGFTERLADADAVLAAARARPVGYTPERESPSVRNLVEREHRGQARGRAADRSPRARKPARMDPMDGKLWGLRSVRADLARDRQAGQRTVEVGIMDTGVDASHPDIGPNFNRALSRNFAPDIPYDEFGNEIDGPCEYRGCVDPPDVDGEGHGTHTAGTIAAAANGFGISGVAPNVSLVNVRAAQDSGYFFLQPVVDAITYSADAGLDVVNMSFYVDPWMFNCTNNSADSPEQRAQQRATIVAMQRALNYAHSKGVTMLASLGNSHSDLGAPQDDTSSPNFPKGIAHDREINNNSCLKFPVEGAHTLGVSGFGPSQAKADYSDYGKEQIAVSAPGGYYRDYFGTDRFRTLGNLILSTYPRAIGEEAGHIGQDGRITDKGRQDGVLRYCDGPDCGYYQYLQGTSMAAPHASGVAALIVSEYGKPRRGMNPDNVRRVLEGTAREIPCPTPRTVDYLDEGRDESYTATCAGNTEFNGFYGHGAVDALSAITQGRRHLH